MAIPITNVAQPQNINYTISQDKFFMDVITNTTINSDGTAAKTVASGKFPFKIFSSQNFS